MNAQLLSAPGTSAGGELPVPIPAGGNSVTPLAASPESSLGEQAKEFAPGSATPAGLPRRSASRPISGVVSLRELEHPVPKKAIREAHEALRFAHAKNFPKAIAKLEDAIRFYPEYRDAHLNLGAVYARAGRFTDARAEFQEALEIGPPAAVTYADLALISLALDQSGEAETFAYKALELDPANSGAKLALQYASQR